MTVVLLRESEHPLWNLLKADSTSLALRVMPVQRLRVLVILKALTKTDGSRHQTACPADETAYVLGETARTDRTELIAFSLGSESAAASHKAT